MNYFVLAVCFFVSCDACAKEAKRFSVVFEWKTLDYKWARPGDRKEAIESGQYIPKNNAVAGVKVWKDRVFVTVPRWKLGVPATISSIPLNASRDSPILEPFPNWKMQEFENCSAFQYIQSMTIDENDRMWIIDCGRTESTAFDNKQNLSTCPPKLVIIDLKSVNFETGDFTILRTYEFPEVVASKKDNFLNDIVVDDQNGVFAYISDNGADSGIVVYSFAENSSWKVRDSKFSSESRDFDFNGVKISLPGNKIDGIALSPSVSHRHVYYCALGGLSIHSIPTFALQNPKAVTASKITVIGQKSSNTDGMIFDKNGNLHFGLLEKKSVGVWNENDGSFEKFQTVFDHDEKILQWPDTFAIYDNHLWVTANGLASFLFGALDENKVNFRILKAEIGAKSYLSGIRKIRSMFHLHKN